MRLFALVMISLTAVPALADDPKPQAAKVAAKAADSDAPLAEGFPKGTEPGVTEVKHYPAYRSAVAEVDKATMSSSDTMFFSLFNHIQKNKIEMTAPVISTFKNPEMIETPGTKGKVTMEFVYREPNDGKTGKDGVTVEVKDHPAQEFLCLGVQGQVTDGQMRDGVTKLKTWLEDHKAEWTEAGPARRIGYHGPMTPVAQRLWEVQIPIKAVAK